MTSAVSGIDLSDPSSIEDPYAAFDALREREPVHRLPGTDFYAVTSWALVMEALGRTEEFSSNLTGVLVRQPEGPPATFDMDGGGSAVHVLATADDPTHQQHRKLVLPTLVAKRIRALEPKVAEVAARLVREGAADGRIEWVEAVADRLPLVMVAHLVGLPEEDVPQLISWSYDATEMLDGLLDSQRLTEVVGSAAALTGYLFEKFAQARQDPADDLMGDLARACGDGDLEDHVAVLMLVQLVGAGGESTAGLLANAARELASRPDLQQRLRADRTLLPLFLEESLRLESPFRGHHRHVRVEAELGGVVLPAGSHLLLMWGSANRDPAEFARPAELDLGRENLRTHLAFGRGAHFCVGAALARLEARVALTALLDASDTVTLAGDTPPERVPSLFVRRHRTLTLEI